MSLVNFTLIALVAVTVPYGCYRFSAMVSQALQTGNLVGPWGIIDRNKQPNEFWIRLSAVSIMAAACAAATIYLWWRAVPFFWVALSR
jgi:hypothetical protein